MKKRHEKDATQRKKKPFRTSTKNAVNNDRSQLIQNNGRAEYFEQKLIKPLRKQCDKLVAVCQLKKDCGFDL